MNARLRALTGLTMMLAAGAAYGIDITRPGDPIIPSSANSPPAEAVANVIDNTAATKYLNFDEVNTGFTVTPSGTGIPQFLTIITANDSPARDPASYTLEGSNDGINFTPIAAGAINAPTDRFAYASAAFSNSTSYAMYRVIFPTVRNAASANSMQVAEVQLATSVDVTAPLDGVTITLPPGGTTGPGEGVNSLFDDKLGTKLDVQNATGPTTVEIIPLAGATILTGLSYASANDDLGFPGRTPQTIDILGSLDGVNFTPIFSTALVQATDNYQDQEFEFANTTAYTRYRVVLGAPFSSTDMQVGDLQLLGTVSAAQPPANDACANAIVITPGTVSGTTNLAGGTDITPCGAGDTIDVWYRYNATATGQVEVNTCSSTADTTLAVFGTCGGSALACDDNGCFLQSLLRFPVTSGQSYLIRVSMTGGATGPFRLALNDAPVSHTDVAVPLAYNFNGMVQPGEEGIPDDPNGYRSISDRGLIIDSDADSMGVGTILGMTGIHFNVVHQAFVLDIVQLGDRNTVDNFNHVFDTVVDGDNTGIQPDWLPNSDHTGPQTTDVTSMNIVMGPQTRLGILYQISNGGGFFNWTLSFSDGSSVSLLLEGPDWFFDQDPTFASPGVEQQLQLGVFRGSENVDLAQLGASLNVVESITSVPQLLADGFGDFTGLHLTSLTVSGASNTTAGYAVIATSVRDSQPNCTGDFNRDGTVNSQDFFDFLTAFFTNAPNADFNHDGSINSQDYFDFLTAFFTGC